jgi:hypothetical protein
MALSRSRPKSLRIACDANSATRILTEDSPAPVISRTRWRTRKVTAWPYSSSARSNQHRESPPQPTGTRARTAWQRAARQR